ncbi:hypothetical protein V6N11_002268 [Hibiscus sabdariffa]|uniref:Transmembrane protein n=1 Tax=Hibiscus sabdariffa TaxID=183260 RepID=A0ABR2QUR1_9ROSI
MLVGLLRIVNLGVDSVADGWFWVNLNEGYSMGFGDGEWLVACAQLGSMVGARCFGWQGISGVMKGDEDLRVVVMVVGRRFRACGSVKMEV